MPTASSSLLQVLARPRRRSPRARARCWLHQLLDLLVLARVQRREREVLELPLDRVDAEPVRQRGEDLERLLRLLLLLLLRHRVDRAHVVQPVGELDQDDPDVRGHRDHHLAVVLGLAVVAALEGDPGELRDAVDELRDLLAELVAHLVERRARVLDRVVQQRRAQRAGVEAHARADLRHADRVHDEVLAARAALVGVALAGEHEARSRPACGRPSRPPRSACSSTTANRSPSSTRCSSVSVRSGGTGACVAVLVDRAVLEVARRGSAAVACARARTLRHPFDC